VADTRWLTAEEQAVWRRLVAVMAMLPAALDAQLQRDAELTHFAYWVLVSLSEAPGRAVRMSELAEAANGSQSRLSHMISRLEHRGWIRRERVCDDGRGTMAVLTDAGFAKLERTAPGHVDLVRSLVFDKLTPEQVADLDGVCAALLDGLPLYQT
jgi:DNA-binding MarR family transcriptional regulator